MATHDPNLLVLPEHGGFRIGRDWDPARQTIGDADTAALARLLQRLPTPPLSLGRDGGRASQWVGTIAFGEHAIEVVPKIDRLESQQVRENLLWMLSIAGLVPIAPAEIARMARSGKPLLTTFLALYLRELAREVRRGPPRRYVAIEENRPCIRGKLLMAGHLRNNLFTKQRFLTLSDEFTLDNPITWVLKAALRVCANQRADGTVAADALALLPEFDGVSDVDSRALTATTVMLDRTLDRFRPLIQLAVLILERTSPERQRTGAATYSLLFDMNQVFERFVTEALRRALAGSGLSVRGQVTGRHLLRENGRGCFGLRPDIGLFQKGRLTALLDTKWKRLSPDQPNFGIAQADMYQAYAYGKEYDVSQTLFVYPRWGSLVEAPANYLHGRAYAEERNCQIGIRTLDLSRPLGSPATRSLLVEDLKRLALDAARAGSDDCVTNRGGENSDRGRADWLRRSGGSWGPST